MWSALNKLIVIVRNFTKQITRDNINAFAASTGFFFFLSIFPTLVIICSVLPYTPLTEGNLIEAVVAITPDTMDLLVISLIHQAYNQSVKMLPLAIIVAIWSSGKGMLALMRGLNVVNEVEENRSYFLLRMEASCYMVITIIALMISLFLSVFGKMILLYLIQRFPHIQKFLSLMIMFRFVFVWLFLTVIFTIVYTYVPNKKLKILHQLPGSVITAIGWNLFSYIFSVYINRADDSSIYGSFSTIIFLMVWLYFCIYILLLGANMNRYFNPIIQVLLPYRKYRSVWNYK